jgi:hypothetical protein
MSAVSRGTPAAITACAPNTYQRTSSAAKAAARSASAAGTSAGTIELSAQCDRSVEISAALGWARVRAHGDRVIAEQRGEPERAVGAIASDHGRGVAILGRAQPRPGPLEERAELLRSGRHCRRA